MSAVKSRRSPRSSPKAKRLRPAAFSNWLRARRADLVFREQLRAGIAEFRKLLETPRDEPYRRRRTA